MSRDTDIAIIGLAGRFASAASVEDVWAALSRGDCLLRRLSVKDMLYAGATSRELAMPDYINVGGVGDAEEHFDANVFGLGEKAAQVMDVQHRVYLECALEALDDAARDPARFEGRIGHFAGASSNTYRRELQTCLPHLCRDAGEMQLFLGNDAAFLPTLVSYRLNLRGPSVNVQTACSTSLVAVHLAVQSLLLGDCDMALAGGVSVRVPARVGYRHELGGILSADGRCRPFDAKASGTVPGAGCGIVVLRRLSDAIQQGDRIRAVIRGSAVNNDGADKMSFVAPSIEGQRQVLAEALQAAELDAGDVDAIECHGTATTLGDAVEVQALREVFDGAADRPVFIGSIKGNVGHMDAAAGIAGLIKGVLSLEHESIPQSIGVAAVTPAVLESRRLRVATTNVAWPRSARPRRMGISSFGVGGTNAHVVLEEAPLPETAARAGGWQVVPLSAASEASLDALTQRLCEHISTQREVALADLAWTMASRPAFRTRRYIVARNAVEFSERADVAEPRLTRTGVAEAGRRTVFMFPGLGSQYAAMVAALLEEPLFRQHIDGCAAILKSRFDLVAVLAATDAGPWERNAIAQPALVAVEYALAELWRAWGVSPVAMLGHSLGEFVCAQQAGAMTLQELLTLVADRGELCDSLAPGAMLAAQLAEPEATALAGADVWVAVVNGPDQCVFAGGRDRLAALDERLQARGVRSRWLRSNRAFHSPLMAPIAKEFERSLRAVRWLPCRTPFLSNVTGKWISDAEVREPEYWIRHLCQTARFGDCVRELLIDAEPAFLEVGPGHVLSNLLRKAERERSVTTVSCIPNEGELLQASATIRAAIGAVWISGVDVDWRRVLEDARRIELPRYAFERREFALRTTLSEAEARWQRTLTSAVEVAEAEFERIEAEQSTKEDALDRVCLAYLHRSLHGIPEVDVQRPPVIRELVRCWRRTTARSGIDVAAAPPSLESVERDIQACLREWKDESWWVAPVLRTGPRLMDVVNGSVTGLSLLFPSNEAAESSERSSLRLFDYFHAIAAKAVREWVAGLPVDQPIRVLELGGGSGFTTEILLPLLPRERTEYIFSDVSNFFLQRAKAKFANVPFLKVAKVDFNAPLAAQGLPGHFDLIIAANSLHVASCLRRTLSEVRAVTSPSGMLLIWEIVREQTSFQITAALAMPLVEDDGRSVGHPFLSTMGWFDVLEHAGFAQMSAVPRSDRLGYQVLLAAAPREAERSVLPIASLQASAEVRTANDGLSAYVPTWARVIDLGDVGPRPPGWIVFADATPFGEALAERLSVDAPRVIRVRCGNSFERHSATEFGIRAGNEDDMRVLWRSLPSEAADAYGIVHAYALDWSGEISEGNVRRAWEAGHETLASALRNLRGSQPRPLVLLSRGAHDVLGTEALRPASALLAGIARVAQSEFGHVETKWLDLDASGSIDQQLQATARVAYAPGSHVLAHRGETYWHSTFEKVPSARASSASGGQRVERVVVLGGDGGIGSAIGQYLAQRRGTDVVLVARDGARRPRTCASSANVRWIAADCGDAEALSRALDDALAGTKGPWGVIVATTAADDRTVLRRSTASGASFLGSGVLPAVHLNAALAKHEPHFIAYAAASESLVPGFGQCDRIATHAFVAALAGLQRRQSTIRSTCIFWDRWRNIGLSRAIEARHRQLSGTDLEGGLEPEEVLGNLMPVALGHWPQVVQAQSAPAPRQVTATRAEMATPTEAPSIDGSAVSQHQSLARVQAIWERFIGAVAIGPDANFFEVGGDSLIGLQLVGELNRLYGLSLSPTIIYEAPTIRALSQVIAGKDKFRETTQRHLHRGARRRERQLS